MKKIIPIPDCEICGDAADFTVEDHALCDTHAAVFTRRRILIDTREIPPPDGDMEPDYEETILILHEDFDTITLSDNTDHIQLPVNTILALQNALTQFGNIAIERDKIRERWSQP